MKLFIKINVENLISLKTDVRKSVHTSQTVLKALDKNIMRYTVTLKHKDTGITSTSQARIPLPQRAPARRWGRNCYKQKIE